MQMQETKDQILETALPDIVFDGWTMDVMRGAAVKAGYDSDMVAALFPSGLIDILDHFSDWADRQMLGALKDMNPDDMRIRDRIAICVRTRLQQLEPHKDAVRQSLGFWALPQNSIRAPRIVWRSADVMWNWAGDTATDYNHYTKRGLLSGVISATTLYWLNDESEDHNDSWAFLDRRIENVLGVGKLIGSLKSRLPFGVRQDQKA